MKGSLKIPSQGWVNSLRSERSTILPVIQKEVHMKMDFYFEELQREMGMSALVMELLSQDAFEAAFKDDHVFMKE